MARAGRMAGDRAAGYRRGAVMGLTVAEAFMLIAFALLLLLGVWMATARDRVVALEARLAEAEARAQAAERFADAFDPAQKAAALAARDQLAELAQDIGKLAAFRELVAAAENPADAAQALALLPVVEEGRTADAIAEAARLLDGADMAALARAAAALDPDARRALLDLARRDDVPALAALAVEGGAAALLRDRAALAALEATDGGAVEEARALAAYRATGLAPEAVAALGAQAAGAAEAEREARRSRAQIAAAVEAQAGSVIAEVGGEVRDDGSIVFADRLLFDAGSARITPAFDAALARLCRPWIEALHAERDSLSAVRIEGHASSEWTGRAPAQAYAANLDLSQARAGAVFKRCLDLAGEDAVAGWARSRMSAVGYSSSRPVLAAGAEDRAASRRVVFAIATPADAPDAGPQG